MSAREPAAADDHLSGLSAAFAADRVVDLTLTIAEDVPCWWPTHMPFQHKTYNWFADRDDPAQRLLNRTGDPYQTRWLAIDEHTGTHFDAPSHFIPPAGSGLPNEGALGEVSTDQVEVTQLVGPAAVLDVSDLSEGGRYGESPKVTRERVQEWERNHGELAPGDVVLLRGDWDRHYLPGEAGDAYSRAALVSGDGQGWQAPTAEAVTHMFERGVRCLGTDGVSIGASEDGEPAHVAGLSRGMAYVEALANLRKLPPRGAFFIFLAIKVRGGTGGPGRAVALLP